LDGNILKLSDEVSAKKYETLEKILNEIKKFEHQKNNDSRDTEFSITILIPEGMVSLLIGSKGRSINNLMKDSKTKIVVNQPIHKMIVRTVKIDGKVHHCVKAC